MRKRNTDQKLIDSCLKGQQLAFKQLYDAYVPHVLGVCIRYGILPDHRKDLIQIIFTEAFKSLSRYDATKASFKTWLNRIAVNRTITYLKSHRNLIDTKSLENVQEADIALYAGNDIEEQLHYKELLITLQEMPKNYWLVFSLYVIEGYTHEEIAEQLDISVISSRVSLNRARKWVKNSMVNPLRV